MPRCSARPAPGQTGSRYAAAPPLQCAAAPQRGEGADSDGCWSSCAYRWPGHGQGADSHIRDGGRSRGKASAGYGRQCRGGGLADEGPRRRRRSGRPPACTRQRRRGRRVSGPPPQGPPAVGPETRPEGCTTRSNGGRADIGGRRTRGRHTRCIPGTAHRGIAGPSRSRNLWKGPRRTGGVRWPPRDRARRVGRISARPHVEAAPAGSRGDRGRARRCGPSEHRTDARRGRSDRNGTRWGQPEGRAARQLQGEAEAGDHRRNASAEDEGTGRQGNEGGRGQSERVAEGRPARRARRRRRAHGSRGEDGSTHLRPPGAAGYRTARPAVGPPARPRVTRPRRPCPVASGTPGLLGGSRPDRPGHGAERRHAGSLKKGNDPAFGPTLDSRSTAEKHEAAAEAQYRRQERAVQGAGHDEAVAALAQGLGGIHAVRAGHIGKVGGKQQELKDATSANGRRSPTGSPASRTRRRARSTASSSRSTRRHRRSSAAGSSGRRKRTKRRSKRPRAASAPGSQHGAVAGRGTSRVHSPRPAPSTCSRSTSPSTRSPTSSTAS